MKIEIELPDGTRCASITYVYEDEEGLKLGTKAFDSESIKKLTVDSERSKNNDD